MNDDELRGLLREMRDEPVPAASLVRMRAGLAAGIERPRWRAWKIAALALVPASLLLAVLLLSMGEQKRVPLPPLVARVPQPPLIRESVARPVEQVRVAHRIRKHVPIRTAPQPVLIRIETDDPEIVILLTGE